MAEFTAENFVSQGTEFIRSSSTTIYAPSGFPYPNGTGKAVQAFTDTVTYPSGITYSGSVDYVVGSIYDGNTGQTLPPHRLASSSLLCIWTRPLGTSIVWTENSAVFNDNYGVLIPRAVGYSAGVINHFFRGRLNLARSGATGTNWIITNASAATTGALNGAFRVYAEDSNRNRTQIPGATWSLNIPAGGTSTVSFWHGLDAVDSVPRTFIRFNLCLGGQRAVQLLRATWPAYDFANSTVLLRDSKRRGGVARDHLLPLTKMALDVLEP